MRNKNLLSKRLIQLTSVSFLISLLVFLFSCGPDTDGTGSGEAATTTTTPTTVATGTKDFYYFKIDSAVLVDSFFKKTASPPFKKIIFNFLIKDYSAVPGSLGLVGHGAKNNDVLIDFDPEELPTLTDKETIDVTNLLYSTMEFSRTKIENLVGANGTGKRYTHLVFIPYIETQNGQRHLSYKVQKRPVHPDAEEPTENLNPCPPFKPND